MKIPTTSEMLDTESGIFGDIIYGQIPPTIARNTITKMMIKFAQLHVRAALEAVAEDLAAREEPDEFRRGDSWANRKPIEAAYPLNLIQ